VRRRSQAERGERLRQRPEPGGDHDRVGVDARPAGQLDRRQVPVVSPDDAAHLPVDDVDPRCLQAIEVRDVGEVGGLRALHLGVAVEHDGEPAAQLPEQRGGVEPPRVGDDLDDGPVAELEAVAERAVDDVTPPALGEPVDVGELVGQAGRGEHPPGDDGVAADELDPEAPVLRAGHAAHAPVEDLAAVAADLLTAGGGQLGRRGPLATEVAVHVGGGGVAWLAGVDDDHRPALAAQLEGGREPGGRSADDGDVAVPLDGAGGVVTHGGDDKTPRA
jgi:hypothetical protein